MSSETSPSKSLLPLFLPNAETDGVETREWWYHIEPHHAVGAIRDFLTTGKPNWNNHRP